METTTTTTTTTEDTETTSPINPLSVIAERLRTQDNRCTANPIFCVQVRKRIWGMDSQWCDDPRWIDTEDGVMELPDPQTEEEEETYEANDYYIKTGYLDQWETVEVCFTEKGCEKHLELNGHNYRHYEEVRIYADSIHRNPEMIAVREFLLSHTTPEIKESQK